MKKIILPLSLILLFSAFPAATSLHGFSEENIAAYKQIYESLTRDSHHLQEAEQNSRDIEQLERRLAPKLEEYSRLKKQTDELFDNARYLSRKISDIDATLARLSVATAREVLRVLLRLLVEATDAMMSRSATDQAIRYTRAAIDEVTKADEEQLPVLVEMIRRRREAEESRQEMRDEIEKQRARANELMPRQNELETRISQLNRKIEMLLRQRDLNLSNHQNRLDRYLRTVPDELVRAAEDSERDIDTASRQARGAVSRREPDFSPFISLHRQLAEAIINSRITGEKFQSRWEETRQKAERHYSYAEEAENAYSQYRRKADSIMGEVNSARRDFLSRLSELDGRILAIDTDFITRLESGYATRISNIERVLSRKPGRDEPSLAEMRQLRESSETLAQRYSDLSVFLQTGNETFARQLDRAVETFDEVFLERDMNLRAGKNLAQYAGYSQPPNLEEQETLIKRGRKIITEGPLSFIYRMETMQKAANYEEKAVFYALQLQANEDYQSAAEAFISAADNFSANIPSIRDFFSSEVEEIYRISNAIINWERYYERFKDNPRASLGRQTRSKISRYTLEDHNEKIAFTENLLASINRYSHEYGILFSPYSDLKDAKYVLEIQSSNIKPLIEKETEAREVYSAYERFVTRSFNYLDNFNEYLRIAGTFKALKDELLADFKNAYNGYSSVINGYDTAGDRAAYASRFFDERGRYTEGTLPADGIMSKYRNFVMPFSSDELWNARRRAEDARLGIYSLATKAGRELFTGPELIEMRIGNSTFRRGFTYAARLAELAREDLTNGSVVIEGELRVYGKPAETVLISKNGGMTYNYRADITGPGTFRYEFRPGPGTEYYVTAVAVDQRGNEGRRFPFGGSADFVYTGYSYERALEVFFDNIAESYRRQDPFSFMNNVSWNYLGRYENLERAVERDFENFDAIDMQFNVESVTLTPDRKNATVKARWRRSWTNINSGERIRDEGDNTFRLTNDEGQWLLLSYSGTPVFGILVDLPIESPAAGGRTADEIRQPGLTIHRNQTLERYTAGDGFSFVQGKIVKDTGIGFEGTSVISYDGPNIKSLGFMRLEDVHNAPISGYDNAVPAEVGHSYVAICENGNYAKFRIIDVTFERIIFDWAYQPDGSRDLR